MNISGSTYRVYGHKGKQVRDNIHADDVARFAEEFINAPRVGEVYNCGGGRANSCSILEAFARVEVLTGKPMKWEYVDRPRVGDHVCYISDLAKMRRQFPNWSVTRSLDRIFEELAEAWSQRLDGRSLGGKNGAARSPAEGVAELSSGG
jgi:CDP-paratose 2-epimerase